MISWLVISKSFLTILNNDLDKENDLKAVDF